MIIDFKNQNQQDDTIYADEAEVREYIQDMLAELCMVAGKSGLQDIQAFLSVTHQAIIEARKG